MGTAEIRENIDLLVREVGPREGFQIEKASIPTLEKVRLIDLLARSGLRDIQVTSFVNPNAVPQMADAEELVGMLTSYEGVRYSATVLNRRGLERALATGTVSFDPRVVCSASEAFSVRNLRRTVEEVLAALPESLSLYREIGVESVSVGVNAAFGCNWSGPVAPTTVMELVEKLVGIAEEWKFEISEVYLADTMGWANPDGVKWLVKEIQKQWPGKPVGLHLHDTRGMGIANAYAALECGVLRLDSSIGGLGGCPFGGSLGASGNIATEELVSMCDQLGVRTGVDIDRLLVAASAAEEIVGHQLPGKILRGGTLGKTEPAPVSG